MKRLINMVLITMVMVVMCGLEIVKAGPVPVVDELTEAEYLNIIDYRVDDMEVIYDKEGHFDRVCYFVKSIGSSSGVRYRTTELTFKVGEHGPASIDALPLTGKQPEPGEVQYSLVTMERVSGHFAWSPSCNIRGLSSKNILQVSGTHA